MAAVKEFGHGYAGGSGFADAYDVLVVGAGAVGLAAAAELGSRRVRCLVVDHDDRTGDHSPRAKIVNVRTREHFRRWGLADELKYTSPLGSDLPSTAVFVTRMNGHLLARFDNAMNGSQVPNNLYAEEAQWVPQYALEDVLRRYVTSRPGVDLRVGHEFLDARQDDSGVTARIRAVGTGETHEVRCRFLIGADGPRSRVRDLIGARMTGTSSLSRNCTIVFRAPDLAHRHPFGRAIMYWLVNDDVPGLLGPMDDKGLWFFTATRMTDNDLDGLDLVGLIRRTTGLHDLDVEIIGADPWVAHSLLADCYSRGRMFLAGDACHLNPPHGGFGMNMGIGDAVDLGWKTAAVLQGWGGEGLLRGYESERRPIHTRLVDEAVSYHNTFNHQLVRPGMEETGLVGEATRQEVGGLIELTKIYDFKSLGLVLGSDYRQSPLVVSDGSAPPPVSSLVYTPSAHPGCLAPHLWLRDGSSLYDHFGPGLSLLVTSGDPVDAEPLLAAARTRGVPMSLVAPRDVRLPARYEARYTLVRPDQHVAWRGETLPEDAYALLDHVCGNVRRRQ
ncbi:FAD-dependent monooxygenase [Streptomyces sp. NPDC005820]|uniref:FAD-dependent monooxygenase n=1 Tax=Streptomyces sp. NPDC005820 TaxID=3157069 RepID=UPI0033C3D436